MQMVPLPWRTFGRNLPEPRGRPGKAMRAALKAAEELKAEQAAHCQSKKEIAEMAIKLMDATDRCKFLEQEVRLRRILKRSLPKPSILALQ